MRDLDHASRLIEATVAATSKPVTLKMRLGWDDASLNAPELARRAENLGVRLITVHGRTRCQFYKGHARWHLVRETVASTKLSVLVNGDIHTFADAKEALAQSGAAGVMIGRGALGKPWLVGEIAAQLRGEIRSLPTPSQMAEAAITHYEFLLQTMGVEVGLRHARKHIVAYLEEAASLGSPEAEDLRSVLCQSNTPHDVIRGLEIAFHTTPEKQAA
jgi:tRNA-dihydrouridine synthase B